MIQFYKGDSTKYDLSTHGNGIYFTTDTAEILTGEKSFGKNADQSVTTEAITIEGGPLASQAVKDAYPNGVIPKNTSIQDILSKLLCDEKWPTPSISNATLTASVTAPTPSLSASSKDSSLVEVGDTITVAALTAGNTTTGGTNKTTVSGFTYGLSAEDDNEADKNTNGSLITSITSNRSTPVANSGETHSMSVTVTGMTDASFSQPVANATASKVTCAQFTGKAVLGTNKVSVTEYGVGYTANVPAINEVFIISNLGNTKGRKFEGVAKSDLSATPSSSTKEASLTGVYAIYSTGTLYGSFGNANDANAWNNQSDTYMKFSNETTPQRMKLSSSTSGSSTFYGYVGFGADSTNGQETKKFVLLPAGWSISAVHIPDASVAGKWVTSTNQTATRVKAEGEADAGYDFVNNSGHTSKYTKWQIKGSTAANLFKLTISKN